VTKLEQLCSQYGQSPWLDNLTRGYLRDGTLLRMTHAGIRGVTANPTIFARAIEGSASKGNDGFVSIEVAPELADDSTGTVVAARRLHQRIGQPNLFVKIPATAAGVDAIRAMTAEGRSINVTLIFSLARYAEVIDAYLAGLEAFADASGDLSKVRSVASFFVSRVDTEVDRRLDTIGTAEANALRGAAGIAQAKIAYQLFGERLAGERWRRLAVQDARPQRPLWASTSTKDPAYRDTRYVESLIGPDTVNTLPEATIAALEDHGVLGRTVDADVGAAHTVMGKLSAIGIDMDDVGLTLEEEGVASFHESFQGVLETLDVKARRLAVR